ncbi:hypothetical protein ACPPVS_14415 [Cellulomonas sp. McL0617]|uniref:hypothetical protein n=1 Tax=Cellulomonas sp. McL0617 TaxID=3415675 RepID=UPI003CF548A2
MDDETQQAVMDVVAGWQTGVSQGDADMTYDLAMYRWQVQGDDDEALRLLEPLAGASHVPSMRAVAQLWALRDEEPWTRTRDVLTSAASTGDVRASFRLGSFLLHDVCEPPELAEPWLLAAAEQGSGMAMGFLSSFVYMPLGNDVAAALWRAAADAAGPADRPTRLTEEERLESIVAGSPWWRHDF